MLNLFKLYNTLFASNTILKNLKVLNIDSISLFLLLILLHVFNFGIDSKRSGLKHSLSRDVACFSVYL